MRYGELMNLGIVMNGARCVYFVGMDGCERLLAPDESDSFVRIVELNAFRLRRNDFWVRGQEFGFTGGVDPIRFGD
jgi:hypothetical protein